MSAVLLVARACDLAWRVFCDVLRGHRCMECGGYMLRYTTWNWETREMRNVSHCENVCRAMRRGV